MAKKATPVLKDELINIQSKKQRSTSLEFLMKIKKYLKLTHFSIEASPFRRLVKENGGFPSFGLLKKPYLTLASEIPR